MSAPGGWLEEEAKRLGAKFYSNDSLGNTANPLRLWDASRTLLKAVTDFQPNLVACHSTIAGLIGRFTLRNSIPTVFTAHGWSFTQGAKLYRRVILPILERMATRYCEKIICVSNNDLKLAIKHRIAPKEKIIVIHNGVETFAEIASSVIRPPRNDRKVRIVFIGRLAPPKDPLLLLRTLPKNTHLTIIGDGPDKRQLVTEMQQLRLEERITLTGALSREATLRQLENTDLFVLPTRYEGLPYTILEAMAHGVPVIASDVGGVKEAVGDDAGIVMPPNDATALREALERLIDDPELRKRMGEAGRRKTQTEFSLETMCQKTFDVYSDIMKLHEP